MSNPPLPNFFIVGTGKAGTTSLFHYLRQHPQIYMSPIKEPCYFASEIRADNLTEAYLRHIRWLSRKLPGPLADGQPVKPLGWLASEWDDYVRLFQNVATETAIGEASVAYLWSQTAAENIAARIPDARIIMILRDPSERAFSQYLHQLAVGLTHSTFRAHIEACRNNRDRKLGTYYPLLEVGLYHDQVKRYLQRFSPANIRIYWYEEAWREPACFLSDLFQFLGVDSRFRPDMSRKSLERRAPRSAIVNYAVKQFGITHRLNEIVPSSLRRSIRKIFFRSGANLRMNAEDRQHLIDYYREDIKKLGALLNRDLTGWLR